MITYLALLRGVNVGGNNLINMSELKKVLTACGLSDVQTYIQSGNVIFLSDSPNTNELAVKIKATIQKRFKLTIAVAVFSKEAWKQIIDAAPKWWGYDKDWKHNLLVMIHPYDMQETVRAISELKPDIEAIERGKDVLYQSMSLKLFGRTTTGKLAKSPVYKKMTIRNYNTATKLLSLLD